MLSGKESSSKSGYARRIPSLSREDPLEEGMATPLPVFLPGESHGQRSLVDYSPWGHKESDTTESNDHVCTLTLNVRHNFSIKIKDPGIVSTGLHSCLTSSV